MKTINSFCLFFLLFIALQFSSCIGYALKYNSTPYNVNHHKSDYPARDWKQLIVYDELDPNDKYEKIARIIITGNGSASERKLLKRMRKEAGKYSADAILFVETREVPRLSFNGLAATFNIISIFSDSGEDEYYELDMGGEYYALEVEGIAIRFIEE